MKLSYIKSDHWLIEVKVVYTDMQCFREEFFPALTGIELETFCMPSTDRTELYLLNLKAPEHMRRRIKMCAFTF